VIDDCSDWMSFHDAVAHVEARQQCYEDLAIELLRQAAHGLKIRTRLVQSSPRWVLSGDKYYEDNARDLQFCREDVLKLWPEQHCRTKPIKDWGRRNFSGRSLGP
jgi:hypothetical protein